MSSEFKQIAQFSPPWTQSGQRIERLCRKALFQFQLIQAIEEGGGVALALSGGKDSLSLLAMLAAIRGRGVPQFRLEAIHVGGEFSCGASVSQKVIEEACSSLSIPLHICTPVTDRPPTECYSCSRVRRRQIFDRAKEIGLKAVAFGHHRDDSNETLLMNLLQKGEFAANLPLVPMLDYGVTIIRPLILVPVALIREFAKQQGFLRITCQCPVGQQSMRRHVGSLVEQMEKLFPNVRTNLLHASLNYGSTKAMTPR